MSSITDALKAKHPEATGDTIAEVIRTMDASGGGSGTSGIRVINVIWKEAQEAWEPQITTGELVELLNAGTLCVLVSEPHEYTDPYTISAVHTSFIQNFTVGKDPENPSETDRYVFYPWDNTFGYNIYGHWNGTSDFPDYYPTWTND